MLALAQLALSLSLPTQKPAVASKQFRQITSVLPLGQPTASAVDVVNVLGRWDTYAQWERVGELAQMDKLFDANYEFKVKPKAQQSSGLLGGGAQQEAARPAGDRRGLRRSRAQQGGHRR